MTLGFPSGSKTFCELLWVSCEDFVLHGYAWIHWVAKSCTTTAYRWLFRDSQLSLRTLWPACSGISFSTKISLNSCSHSRISEYKGSPRSFNNVSPRSFCDPFLFVFWNFTGLINIGSPRSFINRSCSHWRDVTFNSILSFSSLGFTYRRWWRRASRRCWAMTLLSWKCPWSWRIRSWREICWQAWNHDRNEVLRVALYPNPVF